MKYSELIKLLKKNGCYIVRKAKGSHQMWKSPITNKKFVIPNHPSDEVGKGLESRIKKDAGIK